VVDLAAARSAGSDANIAASLLGLRKDRAAIVIAHRLVTLNDIDRIMVIDRGRVAEHGTRGDLLQSLQRFADM
jgi:ABC-type multidrug transport system fused ATPase/permease subunit